MLDLLTEKKKQIQGGNQDAMISVASKAKLNSKFNVI